ncbi:MupG family TIM beta-alpha barrel fold protein [Pediococcus siamensis]|uniref:MupG family TIM beta-alpha barrel fold protein n=1 Tax=Pediococcus siamensis TaxID=381829 RepID=UPI0039A324F1
MLGFSIYLDTDVSDQTENYLAKMAENGFEGVFTSVHIPEEDAKNYVKRLKKLGRMCAAHHLSLTVDTDLKALENLHISIENIANLQTFGISALRLDDGFTNQQIARLSQHLNVALNASTISEKDVQELHANHANFECIEAWHNFYPRPETGLDEDWFKARNKWLHQQHFQVMAFVPGDDRRRGPLYEGLPTLESHRYSNPLVAAVELTEKMLVDKVFIGDPQLSMSLAKSFGDFYQRSLVKVHVKTEFQPLWGRIWHNRPEVARDVIRLVESRQQNELLHQKVAPANQGQRKPGTVTIDNDLYGRYQGEIQICKVNLPVNNRVNVLGQIDQVDIPLLALVRENTGIEFLYEEEKS